MFRLSLLCCFTFVALAVATQESLAVGITAYWKFNEISGTTAADSSGSSLNHTGTLLQFADDASPTSPWVAGKFDNAIKYNSDSASPSDSYVDMQTDVAPLGSSWTLSSWFLAPLPVTATWNTLFRGGGAHHPVIVQTGTNLLGTFDNTGVMFHSSGFDMSTVGTGWVHLAAVGSGTTTSFYIDGASVGSAAFKSPTDVKSIGSTSGGSQIFADMLDDTAVLDDALTPAFVTSIYSLGDEPTLNYDLGEAVELFDLHAATTGVVTIGALDWGYEGDLSSLGLTPGVVTEIDERFFLLLDATTGVATLPPVPEPSSFLLLGLGALGLLRHTRRRRRRA